MACKGVPFMSITPKKPKQLSYLALAIATIWTPSCFAMVAQNMSVDLRSLSMGNAVTADPPGINAIHFNPAGLTKIKGLQLDIQLLMADFAMKPIYLHLKVLMSLVIPTIRLCVRML